MKITRINDEVYTLELDEFDKDRLYLVASIKNSEVAEAIKAILYGGILLASEDIVAVLQQVPPPTHPVKIGTELERESDEGENDE